MGNDAGFRKFETIMFVGKRILDTGIKCFRGIYTSSNNKYDKEITAQSTGYNVNVVICKLKN